MEYMTVQGTELQAATGAELAKKALENDYYSRFLTFLDAAPKTAETYTRALRQFARWTQEKGITQPTREDIITYRDELKADHKPSTVQSYINVVRLFFRWTAQEGLYPDIADHIKSAKVDRRHKKEGLYPRQVKKVMDGIDRTTEQGKRDYAILALLFSGGLRTIEAVRANVEDLAAGKECAVMYVQGKGYEDKGAAVNIPEETEDAIRDYLKTRRGAKGKEPLFTSLSDRNNGGRMTTRSISRIVKNALISAGYESDRLTAHSTRRTAVNIALESGMTIQEVQQFARHSNIATTMIYVDEMDESKNKCSRAIAKAIF